MRAHRPAVLRALLRLVGRHLLQQVRLADRRALLGPAVAGGGRGARAAGHDLAGAAGGRARVQVARVEQGVEVVGVAGGELGVARVEGLVGVVGVEGVCVRVGVGVGVAGGEVARREAVVVLCGGEGGEGEEGEEEGVGELHGGWCGGLGVD